MDKLLSLIFFVATLAAIVTGHTEEANVFALLLIACVLTTIGTQMKRRKQ